MIYAIKAEIADPRARKFEFPAQKTMYGGKRIATGDTIFLFASENEGGPGLIAMGVVTAASAVPRKRGVEPDDRIPPAEESPSNHGSPRFEGLFTSVAAASARSRIGMRLRFPPPT